MKAPGGSILANYCIFVANHYKIVIDNSFDTKMTNSAKLAITFRIVLFTINILLAVCTNPPLKQGLIYIYTFQGYHDGTIGIFRLGIC